ncbi:uncharacterized protein [Nerophis lumbriciformis]|uniref:uncharacterized protein isoform X2 n=1 Tax=Nerophis lumbriciformis TaxID=546530 RepID=UPI002ADFDBEA|nr:uncharacterized protein LOC133578402 isoform X2 [Nerophis lumbriciformis]XP_061788809.1 uncharacterized protein LOC133578402 isoform X2 [Nerophis lumbriciformis]
MLRELIRERLMAAADEIFGLVERTMASYEEELSRTRDEKERHRRQLEAVRKTQTVLGDVQQLIGRQEERHPQQQGESSALKPENPQPQHIKEEEEELWITQKGECRRRQKEAELTKLPLTVVSVKTEDDDEKPEAHNFLAPLSDSDDTSHSDEDKDRDYTLLSGAADCEGEMRTHTDYKHSEYSEKETARKRGRSDMWEHFNQIALDKVRCLVCSAELKYHGSTSSMIRHYAAKHRPAKNRGTANQVDRKRELDEALVNMMAKDSQSFAIVDDRGFKEFVALLDPTYKLPSRGALEDISSESMRSKKRPKL